MRALTALPENYRQAGSINLAQNRSALLWMNITALVVLILTGWLFIIIVYWLRPTDAAVVGMQIKRGGLTNIMVALIKVLLIYVGMVILHEGVHGFFLWVYTRAVPVFALRMYYAYAAAPAWYLPRNQYLVTALAPLFLLTAIALALLTVVPPGWFLILLVFVASNASGSVGDIYIAGWTFMQPPACLARDQGDVFSLYLPEIPGQQRLNT